jgi:hypothetical protein
MTGMPAKDTSGPKAESSVQNPDPTPEPDSEAQAGLQILSQPSTPVQDPATSQWALLQPVIQFNNQNPEQDPAGNTSAQAQPETFHTQADASTQTTTGNPTNDGHIEADVSSDGWKLRISMFDLHDQRTSKRSKETLHLVTMPRRSILNTPQEGLSHDMTALQAPERLCSLASQNTGKIILLA